MKLWLDDVRPAPADWEWVKTASDAIDRLRTGGVTEVSLDHDLGDDPAVGDGYDVLLWIEYEARTNDYAPPTINVHSANPVAAQRMEAAATAIMKAVYGKQG